MFSVLFIQTPQRIVRKLSKGASMSIGKGTSFVEKLKEARGDRHRKEPKSSKLSDDEEAEETESHSVELE